MEVNLKPGKYVVAVSGGVDSVVLLDLLSKVHALELIVAHYDHGIRNDSREDRELVQKMAAKNGLPFAYEEGNLGSKASESKARAARYKFLEKVRVANHAEAIVTAHHQDDLLETAVINILRGTHRKGLASLKSRPQLVRPLLDFTKEQIREYAKENKLKWREDSTNKDETILRNYVRHKIMPALTKERRVKFLSEIENTAQLNQKIDDLLDKLSGKKSGAKAISRLWFINLPHAVAKEYLAYYFARKGIAYDALTLERIARSLKTLAPGKKVDIAGHRSFRLTKSGIHLEE